MQTVRDCAVLTSGWNVFIKAVLSRLRYLCGRSRSGNLMGIRGA